MEISPSVNTKQMLTRTSVFGDRLRLSRTQIFYLPFRFEECKMLKYLNLRDNSFSEIPHAVRNCVDPALIPRLQGMV